MLTKMEEKYAINSNSKNLHRTLCERAEAYSLACKRMSNDKKKRFLRNVISDII